MNITLPVQVLLCGGTGTGKTTLLRKVLLPMLSAVGNLAVLVSSVSPKVEKFDHECEYLLRDSCDILPNHLSAILNWAKKKSGSKFCPVVILDDLSYHTESPLFKEFVNVFAREYDLSVIYVRQNLSGHGKSSLLNSCSILVHPVLSFVPKPVLHEWIPSLPHKQYLELLDRKKLEITKQQTKDKCSLYCCGFLLNKFGTYIPGEENTKFLWIE